MTDRLQTNQGPFTTNRTAFVVPNRLDIGVIQAKVPVLETRTGTLTHLGREVAFAKPLTWWLRMPPHCFRNTSRISTRAYDEQSCAAEVFLLCAQRMQTVQ
jgi:hypothetical protein